MESLTVKRTYGLGNVICLLLVLDKLLLPHSRITVAPRAEWIDAFSALKTEFTWQSDSAGPSIDLDALAESHKPLEHRTDELGRQLGEEPPVPPPLPKIPEQ